MCADGRDRVYWHVRNHYKRHLRVYKREEGDMLTRRFITDREGIGRTAKESLAFHRPNAMGCSERHEVRKLMSDEFKAMLAELHASVIQDKRFKNLSLDELDRALLWGCLRYRAWSDTLTLAVVSEAGCFFGGFLALNVCSGGYATPMLEALCEFAPAARPPIPSTPNSRGLAIRPFCLAEPRVAAAAAAAQTRGSSTSASSGAGSS